jgi:hypothetical protein
LSAHLVPHGVPLGEEAQPIPPSLHAPVWQGDASAQEVEQQMPTTQFMEAHSPSSLHDVPRGLLPPVPPSGPGGHVSSSAQLELKKQLALQPIGSRSTAAAT